MQAMRVPAVEDKAHQAEPGQGAQQDDQADGSHGAGALPIIIAASLPLKPWTMTKARSIRLRRGLLGI